MAVAASRSHQSASSPLLWPEKRQAFIDAVEEAYFDQHAVHVTLTDEQMEEAVRVGSLRSQLMQGEVVDLPSHRSRQT